MPPENSDNTPIQPSIQSPQQADVNSKQAPPPQFPPVNTPQNITPEPPPANTFPTKKLLMGIAILLIVIGLAGGGFFLYQKTINKDSAQNKPEIQTHASPNSESNSTNQKIANSPTKIISSGKTWNDCKILPNESDYVPLKIGENTADARENAQPQGFGSNYLPPTTEETKNLDKNELMFKYGFAVEVVKSTPGGAIDINNYWQTNNKQWGPDNLNKDFNGTMLLSTSKESYFSNEALITVVKDNIPIAGSGKSKEIFYTHLMSLIPSHNMLVILIKEGSKENRAELINNYQMWFGTICQPK